MVIDAKVIQEAYNAVHRVVLAVDADAIERKARRCARRRNEVDAMIYAEVAREIRREVART